MFDFKVSHRKDETVSELSCDDIYYCVYTTTISCAVEIHAYIINRKRGGIIRCDYIPLFQNFFWSGPQTIMYAGAK